MTTKQKKAIKAMQAARKVHHNIEGKLVCGEERRAGIRNQEDVKLVTCEDCLKGKRRTAKKATKAEVANVEVKADTPKVEVKARNKAQDGAKKAVKKPKTNGTNGTNNATNNTHQDALATLIVGNVKVMFLPVG
jgi:tRNA G10  N-methylase Trm11